LVLLVNDSEYNNSTGQKPIQCHCAIYLVSLARALLRGQLERTRSSAQRARTKFSATGASKKKVKKKKKKRRVPRRAISAGHRVQEGRNMCLRRWAGRFHILRSCLVQSRIKKSIPRTRTRTRTRTNTNPNGIEANCFGKKCVLVRWARVKTRRELRCRWARDAPDERAGRGQVREWKALVWSGVISEVGRFSLCGASPQSFVQRRTTLLCGWERAGVEGSTPEAETVHC
jgi:hypothetical protein